jgi:hypothetical protein
MDLSSPLHMPHPLPVSSDHPNNICHTCTPTERAPSAH